MTQTLLERRSVADVVRAQRVALDPETLARAREIVEDVRQRGEAALREHAERLGDVEPGGPLVLTSERLREDRTAIPPEDLSLLERTATRIRGFATAQKGALLSVELSIPGGRAGQEIAPVDRAGCYAPGGRFPLPSSVLMTAVTARTAGVEGVWVASPRPAAVTRAAASVAGVDGMLTVGGAQAVAALAFGGGVMPACDVVVGPGNRWVTAAKYVVSAHVGIDMLAGPSELVVVADGSAQPGLVAADLLAQAEHDPDALVVLVTTSSEVVDRVEAELAAQLADLPTAETATEALAKGFAVVVEDVERAADVCNRLAPEHLELHVEHVEAVAPLLRSWGGLFVGAASAEVLGDYGAGPNHTLPTSGTARYTGGLSVLDFLRVRTWMRLTRLDEARELVEDAARMAELEGLGAHARAARRRLA
jgi:phosphoribosyl-ATP pyrophosphohydrolase/phosphoribosyl-AMP cyclohydrolase/histidinol dehydrogenase